MYGTGHVTDHKREHAIITTKTIVRGAACLVITSEADHSYRVWTSTPTFQLTALEDAQFWTYQAANERLQWEWEARKIEKPTI